MCKHENVEYRKVLFKNNTVHILKTCLICKKKKHVSKKLYLDIALPIKEIKVKKMDLKKEVNMNKEALLKIIKNILDSKGVNEDVFVDEKIAEKLALEIVDVLIGIKAIKVSEE